MIANGDDPVSKKPVKAMAAPGIEPGIVDTPRPEFIDADPTTLLVEEHFQLPRGAAARVAHLVSNWDWRSYRPPIVTRTDDGLCIIEGQETAIAAATHPHVGNIPIQLVGPPDERLAGEAAQTQMQLHKAAVAAGDQDAIATEQVAEQAGVRILQISPGAGRFRPGDTVAVNEITALIMRRGVKGARKVLEILVNARAAPVSRDGIKAVETLLFDDSYRGEVDPEEIASTLLQLGDEADRQAKEFAASSNVPLWRALATILYQRTARDGSSGSTKDRSSR